MSFVKGLPFCGAASAVVLGTAAAWVGTRALTADDDESSSSSSSSSGSSESRSKKRVENYVGQDILDFWVVPTATRPALERLAFHLLSEYSPDFTWELENLSDNQFLCFYPAGPTTYFAVISCKMAEKYVAVSIRCNSKEYQAIRNKSRTCRTRKEAQDLLKPMLGIPPYKTEEEKTNRRKKRGDHVINNGVLKIMRDSIDAYLHYQGSRPFWDLLPTDDLIHNSGRLFSDYHHPFGSPCDEEVERYMIVYDLEDGHVDTNSFFFGVAKDALVNMVKDLMCTAPKYQKQKTQEIRLLTDLMNDAEVYVDQEAKEKWCEKGPSYKARYEESKQRIKIVLQQLGGYPANPPLWWKIDLRNHYRVGR